MSKKIHVRPSKTQAKGGFVVGILFCLIGLFVAIPMAGLFGVVWTAAAIWITYVNWRNGFTDRGIADRVIEINDEDAENISVTSRYGYETYSGNGTGGSVNGSTAYGADYSAERSSGSDIEARLRSLQSLYDQRLITKEEYDEKKQEILKEL